MGCHAVPTRRDRRSPEVATAFAFALVASLLAARAASAQTVSGFALDRFEPAGAGSAWLANESLDYAGHLQPAFAAVADWAWKPLVFYDPAGHELAALVRQQAVLDLDASVTLWNRARVDLNLPVTLAESGADVRIRDRTYGGPEGAGLGDLRLGGDVRFLGEARGRWRVGAGAYLFVPTGGTRRFNSDGGFRVWPRLLAAGERGRLTWAAQAGVHLRPSDGCHCDLAPGSELTWGAAAGWWAAPRVLIGAEVTMSAALSGGGAFSRAAPPAEVVVAGHYAVTPRWRARLGVAPGLSDGPGTPRARVIVGVGYDMASAASRSPTPPAPSEPAAWPSGNGDGTAGLDH